MLTRIEPVKQMRQLFLAWDAAVIPHPQVRAIVAHDHRGRGMPHGVEQHVGKRMLKKIGVGVYGRACSRS